MGSPHTSVLQLPKAPFIFLKLSLIGIMLLVAMLVFQLITLPVEFNASNRAKKQLVELNIVTNNELDDTNTMLKGK